MPRGCASRRAAGDARARAAAPGDRGDRRRGGAARGAVPAATLGAAAARRGRRRGWRGGRDAGLGFELGSNPRERRADRHLGVEIDQDLLDLAGLEDLDLDGALLRLDHGDDVAALDPIAGLDQPLDQRARLHVGAEGGHAELDHGAVLTLAQARPWRPRRSSAPAGSPPFRDGGDRGSALPRCTRGRSGHRAPRMPARRCACRFPPPGCRCASLRRRSPPGGSWLTDAMMVASSSGRRLRKSITSASMFSAASAVGGLERLPQRAAIGDERNVAPGAADGGLVDVDRRRHPPRACRSCCRA